MFGKGRYYYHYYCYHHCHCCCCVCSDWESHPSPPWEEQSRTIAQEFWAHVHLPCSPKQTRLPSLHLRLENGNIDPHPAHFAGLLGTWLVGTMKDSCLFHNCSSDGKEMGWLWVELAPGRSNRSCPEAATLASHSLSVPQFLHL